MFTKAVPHDAETIFYFDGYGNKYVAIRGGLSWRTNNPGLVHSHAITAPQSIGVCGQIFIWIQKIHILRTNFEDKERAIIFRC